MTPKKIYGQSLFLKFVGNLSFIISKHCYLYLTLFLLNNDKSDKELSGDMIGYPLFYWRTESGVIGGCGSGHVKGFFSDEIYLYFLCLFYTSKTVSGLPQGLLLHQCHMNGITSCLRCNKHSLSNSDFF